MNAESIGRARWESVLILISWLVFAAWVICYAAWRAYPEDPSQIRLVFGLPSWVFWGIAVPWLAATAWTIFLALRVMQDHQD